MPPNTVHVARPTKWGNRFQSLTPSGRAHAVKRFREWLAGEQQGMLKPASELYPDPRELRGKNLACWCPLDAPCHADVLLELANRPDEEVR